MLVERDLADPTWTRMVEHNLADPALIASDLMAAQAILKGQTNETTLEVAAVAAAMDGITFC